MTGTVPGKGKPLMEVWIVQDDEAWGNHAQMRVYRDYETAIEDIHRAKAIAGTVRTYVRCRVEESAPCPTCGHSQHMENL